MPLSWHYLNPWWPLWFRLSVHPRRWNLLLFLGFFKQHDLRLCGIAINLSRMVLTLLPSRPRHLSSYVHLNLEVSELPIRYSIGACTLYSTTSTGISNCTKSNIAKQYAFEPSFSPSAYYIARWMFSSFFAYLLSCLVFLPFGFSVMNIWMITQLLGRGEHHTAQPTLMLLLWRSHERCSALSYLSPIINPFHYFMSMDPFPSVLLLSRFFFISKI